MKVGGATGATQYRRSSSKAQATELIAVQLAAEWDDLGLGTGAKPPKASTLKDWIDADLLEYEEVHAKDDARTYVRTLRPPLTSHTSRPRLM